jgi:hypothetical protein
MCSPHNLSSNLSLVQASYAEATVPEEINFLALIFQIMYEAKRKKTNKKKGNRKSNI